jgi:hypothetical protein
LLRGRLASRAYVNSFRELDYCNTAIGDLSLGCRQAPQLPGVDIYEVKLGEFYLMSSLFHKAEQELANLGLRALPESGTDFVVVVGGLGLGYTAAEALKDKRIRELVIVEYLQPVIGWHQREMVPNAAQLNADARCCYHHADFFACAQDASIGFVPGRPGEKVDAILLDIDHSPEHLLDDPTQTSTVV